MSAQIIVSYDGTPNDDDALALGRLLAGGGASLALAYVRHSREYDAERESLAAHDASRRLEQGAAWLGEPGTAQHVVVSASTGQGLSQLASDQGAAMVVFGSDYRTPPGRVEPGTTAQGLLDGGRVAVAIAAAGLRTRSDASIKLIAVPLAGATNDTARQTARSLADALGATVVDSPTSGVDLIVVGSQPGATGGQVVIGGDVRNELENARSSVLVLPADTPLTL
jgi:nucleotide-binding universal stress UspA family protein